MGSPLHLRPYGLAYLLLAYSFALVCLVPAFCFFPAPLRAYSVAGGLALFASFFFSTCAWDFLVCALLWCAVAATPMWSVGLSAPSPLVGILVLGIRCLGLVPGNPSNPFTSLLVPLTAATSLFLPPPVFLPTLLCAMLLPWFLPEQGFAWLQGRAEGAVGTLTVLAALAAAALALLCTPLDSSPLARVPGSPAALAIAITLICSAAQLALTARPPTLASPLRHASLTFTSIMALCLCPTLLLSFHPSLALLPASSAALPSPASQVLQATALLACATGYAAGAAAAGLQELALNTLQLYTARGRRGALLDFYALLTLLGGGLLTMASQAPHFRAAAAALGRALYAGAYTAPAAALHTAGLSALPILTAQPWAQATAPLLTCALLASGLLLQAALSRTCLLLAPCVGEVAHRGSPLAVPPPAVALLVEVPGAGALGGLKALLQRLEDVGVEGVSFLLGASAAGSLEVVQAIVAKGHEVGLLGESPGSGEAAAPAAAQAAAQAAAAAQAGGIAAPDTATSLSRAVRTLEGLLKEAAASSRKAGAASAARQDVVQWYSPAGGARDSPAILAASSLGLRSVLATVCLSGGSSAGSSAEALAAQLCAGSAIAGGLDAGLHIALPCDAELAEAAVKCLRGAWQESCRVQAEARRAQGGSYATHPPLVFKTLSLLHPGAGDGEREAIAN